jgi:hypothetical protein
MSPDGFADAWGHQMADGDSTTPGPTGRSTPSLSSIARTDLIFMVVGLLAFIFSFIDFAHISVSGLGTISGSSITAWHGTGAIAGVLVLLSVGLVAVAVYSPGSMEALPARVIAEGLAAGGLLFFLIRWITLPGGSLFGHHYGYVLAWGGYVTLILVVAQLVSGYFAVQAAGESFPWQSAGPRTAPVPPAGPPTTSAEPWAGAASPPPAPPEAAPAPPETAAAPQPTVWAPPPEPPPAAQPPVAEQPPSGDETPPPV